MQITRCLLALFTLFSCSDNALEKTLSIEINIPQEKGTTVNVSSTNILNLENILLGEVVLDSVGYGILDLNPTATGEFATLQIGGHEFLIFMEPGYRMKLIQDQKGSNIFQGNGSDVNNYLSGIFKIEREIENRGRINIAELDSTRFLLRLDSLRLAFNQYHEGFTDSVQLSNKIDFLLRKRNDIRILSSRQAFQWNYSVTNKTAVPVEFDVMNELPMDSILLINNVRGYALLHHMNLHLKRPDFYSVNELGVNSGPWVDMELKSKLHSDTAKMSPFMREFMTAKSVDFWMNLEGLSNDVNFLYTEFKKRYPTSPYLETIDARRRKLEGLLPGKPAPPIVGITPEGDTLSSTDLKGKLVYVDVWATWCGPCIQEIPYSKKLQRKFTDNPNVVFLNVAVNDNHEQWQTWLQNDPGFGGTHIMEQEGQSSLIMRSYQILGIPHYIIIDQNGNIVSNAAPRPSSGNIEKIITDLL